MTARTKAIIPVHIFGNVVDVPKLKQMIGNKIAIIEDACQAHGSKLNGIHAGSMGDLGAFSFYPTKNLGAKNRYKKAPQRWRVVSSRSFSFSQTHYVI